MKKIREHFWELLSAFVCVLGAIASLVAAIISNAENSYFFWSILASELILVLIGCYNLKIKYSYIQENKELGQKLDNEVEKLKEINGRQQQYNTYVAEITTNLKNLSKLNNEFCYKLIKLTDKAFEMIEILKAGGLSELEQNKKLYEAIDDYSNSLFDSYKRYTSNLINCTIKIVESYLKLKGHTNKISFSVKLFNQPYNEKEDTTLSDIIVYTAFRDKCTYDSKEREIGKQPYTIKGNVDFLVCLSEDQFIINNAKKNDKNYTNEHSDFDVYYNCAVIVPIKIKRPDNTYTLFGYLCCDCLNTDFNIEIFDLECANLLFSASQLYSTFIETLNSNWCNFLPDEKYPHFLTKIYHHTYKGEIKK